MSFPKPVPGLVIGYSFVWHQEHLKGQEEGSKDRPCAVVLVDQDTEYGTRVTVLPITHTPPRDSTFAVELPRDTKRRLGLDTERSWVVVTDANRFLWPGPDLRPTQRGELQSIAFGLLPTDLFHKIRAQFAAAIRAGRAKKRQPNRINYALSL